MSNLLGVYKQTNYKVWLYDDGTKIRETFNEDDTEFVSYWPESIDVCLSHKCSNGCEFCYANCTPDGREATLFPLPKVFKTMHPFTELALNINSEILPDFERFLRELRFYNLIPNITVNQAQFMSYEFQCSLQRWVKDGLIFGIGVSLTEASDEFIKLAQQYPNLVVHVIAGIVTDSELDYLSDKGLKLLVLGYKTVGKGASYYGPAIKSKIERLQSNIMDYMPKFKVVSFDNLALEQLEIQKKLPPDLWKSVYMGDDGRHTFYLDLAKKRFARSSLEIECFPMMNDVVEMFNKIKTLPRKAA